MQQQCAPRRLPAPLCKNIAVEHGEISVADLRSAGKSAGQFNGHCFTQGGAFTGSELFFPAVMPALH